MILPTESGQVVWLPHDVVTSGDLSTITNLLPQDRHAHSTGGVVATWGMTTTEPVVSDGMLHVIDQTGRQWAIDAANGSATWERDVLASKPFRDLGYLGSVPDDFAPWVTTRTCSPPASTASELASPGSATGACSSSSARSPAGPAWC